MAKKLFKIISFAAIFLDIYALSVIVSFYNLNIKDALNILSAEAGVPIVYEPNLTGTVTLEFESENIEEVLEIILKPFNYYWTKLDGVYYVGTMNPNNPNFLKIATLLEIPIFYSDAESIRSALPKAFQEYILPLSDSSRLIAYAPVTISSLIANLVTKLDVPPREGKIKFRILDVSEEFLNSFFLAPGTGNLSGLHLNVLQIPISGSYVNLLFEGKDDSQKMRVLSTGQITAQNGKSYKLTFQGQIQTQQISDGKVTNVQNTEVFEINLTPKFALKKCLLNVSLNFTGILFGTNLESQKRGTTLSSNVSLDYGIPYLLAAISYEKKVEKEGGISLLKDLPFLGSLFRWKYYEEERRYILFVMMVEAD